jgi:hypothetical protein
LVSRMALLGGGGMFKRWGLVRSILGHGGCALEGDYGTPNPFLFLSFPSWLWGESLCFAMYFYPDVLSHHGSTAVDPTNHGWTGTSIIVSQNNLFPLTSWLCQVFVIVTENWLAHGVREDKDRQDGNWKTQSFPTLTFSQHAWERTKMQTHVNRCITKYTLYHIHP